MTTERRCFQLDKKNDSGKETAGKSPRRRPDEEKKTKKAGPAVLPDPETEEESAEKRPKSRLAGRLVLLGLAVLLVVGIACMFLFPELFNLDRFIRFFRYMGLRNKEGYGVITYDASANNVYSGFDGCFAVGNESGLTLYDLEGGQKAMIQSTLSEPLISRGEKLCLIYSPGTSYLGAVGPGGKVLLEQNVSGTVLDADVSNDGYLCYLSSESGYKSAATMLSPKQETQFRLTSRTRYLNVCTVSDGGKYLAAASLGEKDSVFCSEVTILRTRDKLDDLDSEESTAVRVDLGNQVIYDLEFLSGGTLCAIGQKNVTFLSVDGRIYQQISLEHNPLVAYDFSEKGFVVLLQRIGMAGEDYRVTTLDGQGEELGLQEFSERVRSVSAAGRYVAVLTDREAQILNRRLGEYAKTEQTYTASRIIARPDGTALLVTGTEDRLYIP